MLETDQFDYTLPTDSIAKERLSGVPAKLLVFGANGLVDSTTDELPNLIPPHSVIVYNDTKVIPARIRWEDSGGEHEIFLLEPYLQTYGDSLSETGLVRWVCIGKHIPKYTAIVKDVSIMVEKIDNQQVVTLGWGSGEDALEIINRLGETPIPPYLERPVQMSDINDYQGIFARNSGAVAAPTASFHLTDAVRSELVARGVHFIPVTLHVGAGTFMPVKVPQIEQHAMHQEWCEITFSSAKALLECMSEGRNIIALGTTALRAVESLRSVDVQTRHTSQFGWKTRLLSFDQAFGLVMENSTLELPFRYSTKLMITPGYQSACDGIITNFHQPRSTLLCLVCALIGKKWKLLYNHALTHGYRFLSYGDTSLLWIPKDQLEL